MSEQEIPQFPELQILSPVDRDEVLAFARARANPTDPFVEWTAPWRSESLDHYLKIGWSMSRRSPRTGQLLGYILAQPILFFRNQTQTVWIEYVDAESPSVHAELLDTIIGVSREKHMQRVLMRFDVSKADLGPGEVIRNRNGKMIEDDIIEFATTKG
jgi:hypothetical protein